MTLSTNHYACIIRVYTNESDSAESIGYKSGCTIQVTTCTVTSPVELDRSANSARFCMSEKHAYILLSKVS